MKAFDTAYPGSMSQREDGDYVLRVDPASLAAALLEGIARRDREISDLQDALEAGREIVAKLETALKQIERWDGFPPTNQTWTDGTPLSYSAAFGSNGERDYMRSIASTALFSTGVTK